MISVSKNEGLVNLISKYCQKYFLYKRCPNKEERKVRTRSNIHRAEDAPCNYREEKIKRRLCDMGHGLFTPSHQSYKPVGGWPHLALDALVLNTMKHQLDPKEWSSLHKHHDTIPRKVLPPINESIEDKRDLHVCPSAGLSNIRARLKEDEKRLPQVYAGHSFYKLVKLYGGKQRTSSMRSSMLHYEPEEKSVYKVRIRKEEIKYLNDILYLMDTLNLIKMRHLKSTVPICLDVLGTARDLTPEQPPCCRDAKTTKRPGALSKRHSFRDQILVAAPSGWVPPKPLEFSLAGQSRKRSDVVQRRSIVQGQNSSHAPAKPLPNDSQASLPRGSLRTDKEREHKKKEQKEKEKQEDLSWIPPKRWPPLWMSIAAYEQSRAVLDPLVVPHKVEMMMNPGGLQRRRSLEDILKTRKDWAEMRQAVETSVVFRLDRFEKEQMDFINIHMSSIEDLPMARPYIKHQQMMDKMCMDFRKGRQKKGILYDCETLAWYRSLRIEARKTLVDMDGETFALLEKIKGHYKLAPTKPRYARARLALIVMSMPAMSVCQISMQRAIDFLLHEVFHMPSDTLALWLSVRGLPYVLV